MPATSAKQRMLNAYRGNVSDRVPVAPEFWYYYPAKVLGVDMIEFQRDVPHHQALKTTFETFECEGWGIIPCVVPNPRISSRSKDVWVDSDTLHVTTVLKTPAGNLQSASRLSRDEPGWALERFIKDPARDLPAWVYVAFGGDPDGLEVGRMISAREEVGESYLLEASLGVAFFDFYGSARNGGFEQAVLDFLDPALHPKLCELQERYTDRIVSLARAVCERTPFEALFIGCSWSCNSLLGPRLWRQWDKPVIAAVADEVHRHGRLLHVHFHGRCIETVRDFAEIGIDCVCPFERPPGGDVDGEKGLRQLAELLADRTTMNGNVHTVETLIRGNEEDVRAEVRQILDCFEGNPRLIVGTGDQVGRETPEENLHAMIDEVRRTTLPG